MEFRPTTDELQTVGVMTLLGLLIYGPTLDRAKESGDKEKIRTASVDLGKFIWDTVENVKKGK